MVIAAGLRGEETRAVTVQVAGTAGKPVSDALVTAGREKVVYGDGFTNADGVLKFHLPPGKYDLEVAALGRQTQKLAFDTATVKTERI